MIQSADKEEFWCKEVPTIVEGKVTRGGMFPHQRTWWEGEAFIKVLVGGYGSGKTLIGCKRLISLALQNAPAPVASVSPSYPICRTTVIVTLQELLQGKSQWHGRKFWWRYNKSTHEFTIKFNGRNARIMCLSGDNPLSLRGPNLAAAYIDEPFIQNKEVFDQMLARVRHPVASVREIGMTGTPEQLNWGYDICIGETEGLDVALVQASTRQNLALPADYVTTLETAYSKAAVEAYVEGQFVNLSEGRVYYGFDAEKNVVPLETPTGEVQWGVGMDFNVNPMAAAVFWRQAEHLHFVEELEIPNSDTQFMCDTVSEKYGKLVRDVYPDASGKSRHTSTPGGKSDFWYLREAGFAVRANHENPKIKDRYNSVNGKMAPKSGKPTCTISPKCRKLVKYLTTYTHELKNKENQKAMSHLLDAMSYPLAYLFPVVKNSIGTYKLKGV